MPDNYEKLLVSWKGPSTKKNYFVGVLTKSEVNEETTYTFYYMKDVVELAHKEGFTPFIGLRDLNKEYRNDKLFSVFERRLPNQNRAVFKKFIQEHQLESSEAKAWEYLKKTKGRTATDNLSFLEPIYLDNNSLLYKGEVAGWSFIDESSIYLKLNDPVTLKNDLSNEADSQAVGIYKDDGSLIGYIPKPFNKVFHSLLNEGHDFTGCVYHIDASSKRPSVLIRTNINVEKFDDGLKPMIHSKI